MNGVHVFGCGTGRCGTRTLSERFSFMTKEARHEGWHYRNGSRTQIPKFKHLIQGRPSAEWNRGAIYDRWASIHNQPHSFEAAHYFTGSLHLLLEAFPECKLLHIVRPAPEVVYSFLNWSNDGCYRAGGAHDWKQGAGQGDRDEWMGWTDSFPEFPGVTGPIEGYAMHWQWTNRCLWEAGQHIGGDRYHLVWLDQLNNPEKWEEVVRFVNPPNPSPVELHASNKGRKPFIPDDYKEVEKICKDICTWRPNTKNAISVFPGRSSATDQSGS